MALRAWQMGVDVVPEHEQLVGFAVAAAAVATTLLIFEVQRVGQLEEDRLIDPFGLGDINLFKIWSLVEGKRKRKDEQK